MQSSNYVLLQRAATFKDECRDCVGVLPACALLGEYMELPSTLDSGLAVCNLIIRITETSTVCGSSVNLLLLLEAGASYIALTCVPLFIVSLFIYFSFLLNQFLTFAFSAHFVYVLVS